MIGVNGRVGCLAFEDGEGGAHPLSASQLLSLLRPDGQPSARPPVDLIFISSCDPGGLGEGLAAAGVPHVVLVRRDPTLHDAAACLFAEHFYLRLAMGKTVGQAFSAAAETVARHSPEDMPPKESVRQPADGAGKFLLLPSGVEHASVLFKTLPAGTLHDMSPPPPPHNLPALLPALFVGRAPEQRTLVAAAATGRSRLICLSGGRGTGKTALAMAAAHYLLDRPALPGGIFWVSAAGAGSAAGLGARVAAAVAVAERQTAGATAWAPREGKPGTCGAPGGGAGFEAESISGGVQASAPHDFNLGAGAAPPRGAFGSRASCRWEGGEGIPDLAGGEQREPPGGVSTPTQCGAGADGACVSGVVPSVATPGEADAPFST